MCSVIINLDRLDRAGADPRIKRVVIIPSSFTPKPRHVAALSARAARVVLVPPSPGPDADAYGFYRDCMSKLVVFALTDYERVVFLDGDSLVMRAPDALFDLPAAVELAAPRAYWIDPGRPKPECDDFAQPDAHVGALPHVGRQMKFTSALLVVQPSERLHRRLVDKYFPEGAAAPQLRHGMFDMDLLNLEFKDEVTLLPGASLVALSQHWQDAERDTIWGDTRSGGGGSGRPSGVVSQEQLWATTHVVHFSQPGKPWYWNATELRRRYPKAHARLYEAYDTWNNASTAMC